MIVIDDMIDNDILLVLEVDIEDRSRSVEVEVVVVDYFSIYLYI